MKVELRLSVFVSLLGAALTATVFSGCASTGMLPELARKVAVVPANSVAIEVHRPRLLLEKGNLVLEAYVFRQWKADTTADSHIDIVFLDAVGRKISVDTASFSPRSLPQTIRLPQPHAYMKVPVRLPPDLTVIEVRGHDGAHESKTSVQNN